MYGERCADCKFGIYHPHPTGTGNDLKCHRYPPVLTDQGPWVIANPMSVPMEIDVGDPSAVITVGPGGYIHKSVTSGRPEVQSEDWCGEFRLRP